MSSSGPPKSMWSRSTRLVQLAAGLAKKELQGRVSQLALRGESLAKQAQKLRLQVEQAQEIVSSLGQLKGAAMKAGQLLSMELREVLPPEVIAVLSQLQASGATVSFEEIDSILCEELGPVLRKQLEVSPVALASASIGQVHRARWKPPNGAVQEVVLKVQFRGIADTIDSDLALLERIARIFLSVQFSHFDVTQVFAELREVLVRETDYLHEAQALQKYRDFAHQVKGLRVPEVFPTISTKRVLAMSFERGLSLDAFLATHPSLEARNRIATQVLDLYFKEFFEWGLVQTDANFANFLVRPAEGELVLLDFGATREYAPPFREHYRALLLSTLRKERPLALQAAQHLNLIDAAEPPSSQEALHHLLETVLRVLSPEFQPVNFQDKTFVDDAGERLKTYYKTLTCSAPPAQLLFLHRKLGGVYSMGRALQANLDLMPFAERLQMSAAASSLVAG
jgi:aarF domain-containing kinase